MPGSVVDEDDKKMERLDRLPEVGMELGKKYPKYKRTTRVKNTRIKDPFALTRRIDLL